MSISSFFFNNSLSIFRSLL
uniref:Uncharacterized protein n=1 Tax=Arundo donax TaxID=35708 RepID=A0A0A9EXF4_ARUDO